MIKKSFVFKLVILLLILIPFLYFFVGSPKPVKEIAWGVHFSKKHAQAFGMDWKKVYLSLLDDLKVNDLRLSAYWDFGEPSDDRYNFIDLDWQLERAKERNIPVLLVIGMKLPRWPECYIPSWARELDKKEQQEKLLEWLEKIVSKYKNNQVIWAWQIENEPLFQFGKCPIGDKEFLEREAELVRDLDDRPIIITDSGEWSFWFTTSRLADIPGATMYQRVWFSFPDFLKTLFLNKWNGFYIRYPFPPRFYRAKADLINKIFSKETIITELQAEPWGPVLLYDLSIEDQRKTMDLEKFKEVIKFAKKSGFSKFYLWGGEWWYWMKTVQNDPLIWDEAKKLW